MSKRQLSVYEKNHLLSHGIHPENIDEYGEMPVEYITSTVRFLGREYAVSPAVLIPRIETEELVELVKKELVHRFDKRMDIVRMLDLGTGSGVIGLSLLDFAEHNSISLDMTLADISSAALVVAEKNYKHLFPTTLLRGSVQFVKSDLLPAVSKSKKFDCIVANLPYIPSSRIPSLTSSVKDFEPLLALDGGETGFDLIERLVKDARFYLTPGGKLFLEIDDSHTLQLFREKAPHYGWELQMDQFEKPRFAIGTLK
jgi:release factor glutamine methyltransferase